MHSFSFKSTCIIYVRVYHTCTTYTIYARLIKINAPFMHKQHIYAKSFSVDERKSKRCEMQCPTAVHRQHLSERHRVVNRDAALTK